MTGKRLFSNRIFGIVFLFIVGYELIASIIQISGASELVAITVLRSLNIAVCLAAFVSFFVITRFSGPLMKLFIVFRLILFPSYILLHALADFTLYSYSRLNAEAYFVTSFSLALGITLYYFFKKYDSSRPAGKHDRTLT